MKLFPSIFKIVIPLPAISLSFGIHQVKRGLSIFHADRISWMQSREEVMFRRKIGEEANLYSGVIT
jgi:hypothetical protein